MIKTWTQIENEPERTYNCEGGYDLRKGICVKDATGFL